MSMHTGFYFTVLTPTLHPCMKSIDSYSNECLQGQTLVKRNILVASIDIIFCLNDFWQPTTAFSTIEFNE